MDWNPDQVTMWSPKVESAGLHHASDEVRSLRRELLKLEAEEARLDAAKALAQTQGEEFEKACSDRVLFSDVELLSSKMQLRFEEEQSARYERRVAQLKDFELERQALVQGFTVIAQTLIISEAEERAVIVSGVDSNRRVQIARQERRVHEEKQHAMVEQWNKQAKTLEEMDSEFYQKDKTVYNTLNQRYEEERQVAEAQAKHEMMMLKIQTILEEEELVDAAYHMSPLGFRSTMEMYDL